MSDPTHEVEMSKAGEELTIPASAVHRLAFIRLFEFPRKQN
jgi:hypothetical protein